LQILDDGRLTDGQGRTVDFKNAVIIMTSNTGSSYVTEGSEDEQTARQRVMNALHETFRPEFLNRIDDIIIFRRLTRQDMRAIVDIQLARLRRLLSDKKITLTLTDAAVNHLAQTGYDPVFGARSLKRVLQKDIYDALSLRLLKGDYKEDDTVTVDYNGSEYVFNRG